MSNEKLIIIGCGGLGQEVLWAARRAQAQTPGWTAEILGFTAEVAPEGEPSVEGLPFLGLIGPGLMEQSATTPSHFICAIGDNQARKRICGIMEALGLQPFTVVDPSVIIGPRVQLEAGTYVGAGSVLAPCATIGRHVMVNLLCTIGHDSQLGDFSQACPGSRVSGWVRIGEGTLLGSNAVVAPKVSLGAWSILGASSLANRDFPSGVTALGVPAKILFRRPVPQIQLENK